MIYGIAPHPDDRNPDDKPDGIAVELGDTIIRILDYCGHSGIDVDKAVSEINLIYRECSLPEIVTECHVYISYAYAHNSHWSPTDEGTMEDYLVICIMKISRWLSQNSIDLMDVIALKHEYNKTRPYKHGNKRC